MSVQDFIFRIGADVSEFEKSITEVEAELNRWKETLKTASKQGIVEANKNITDLTASIDRLKKAGLDKLPTATNNGANALFSLSQVARDLPFGFIAIQNNLPFVIDQFQNLSKTSGGVIGALKSLGGALIGPAGIGFATSIVISSITGLVQQYGSLGGAIDAIIGKQQSLTDLQNAYSTGLNKANESQLAEIANLQSLQTVLTSTNSTLQQRNGAYAEIEKTYPGVLAGLNEEKVLSGQLNNEIAARIGLYAKQIELEGKREFLTKKIANALQAQSQLEDDLRRGGTFEAVTLAFKGLLQGNLINGVSAGADAIASGFGRAGDESKFFTQQLQIVNSELSGINAQIQSFIEEQKRLEQARKEALNNAKESQREQERLDKDILRSNANIAKLRADLLEKEAKKNRVKAAENAAISAKEQADAFKRQLDADLAADTFTIPPIKTDEIIKTANLQTALATIQNTFFNPLTNLFDEFIQTGRFAFKDFAKSVLAAISQIVSKIIATGIINLLVNLLLPGAGGAATGLGKGIAGAFAAAFGSATGFIAPQRVAAPSFASVNGGNLGLTGAVNLTLRGSDLVGAMNRTNTTINRVG